MRILYGITKSNFGGAQRYVYDLARAAQTAGHETRVLLGGAGVLKQKLDSVGISTVSLPTLGRDISPYQDSRSFFCILEALHEFKPEIFHINSSKMGGLGGLAARVMHVPQIIFTAHGWEFNGPRPRWQIPAIKLSIWFTLLLAHKVICVSDQTRRDVAHWPFVAGKLVTIPNGLAPFELLTRQDARQRLSLGVPDQVIIVGTLSELRLIKGVDVLLQAWKMIPDRQKARLILIGEGEERDGLETLTHTLDISESVIFKGFVDGARCLLSGIDIFVLPSRSEALPYSVLEAGFAERPVVATCVGGVPEIIRDEESGLIVPPENPALLASALERLLTNASQRQKLGKKLSQHVRKHFSHEGMVQATLALYHRT